MSYATETVWSFYAGSYLLNLTITPDPGYRYDGDDEGGETQAALDAGDLIAFDSDVTVTDRHGVIIGRSSLGGSVYAPDEISDFWQAHRTSSPEYRNTLDQKAARRVICHYFPDMVREAVGEARDHLRDVSARYVRAA